MSEECVCGVEVRGCRFALISFHPQRSACWQHAKKLSKKGPSGPVGGSSAGRSLSRPHKSSPNFSIWPARHAKGMAFGASVSEREHISGRTTASSKHTTRLFRPLAKVRSWVSEKRETEKARDQVLTSKGALHRGDMIPPPTNRTPTIRAPSRTFLSIRVPKAVSNIRPT
jgi:hypothetical protein